MKQLTIIGGGPAALMLAAQIDTSKYQVTLFDQNKAVGRKFLVAGEGGLNLTYNTDLEALISQYVPSEFMQPIISQFTNEDLISWLNEIGVPTFIGSSSRVFPDMELKPIQVLNRILDYISNRAITFKLGTKWTGWNEAGGLTFEGHEDVESDIVVFSLGGASWKVTGSDGAWSTAFAAHGVRVEPFRAANCAFEVDWNSNFINTHEGKPLKNIALSFEGHSAKGELVVSQFGLEGNVIYALSQKMQEALLIEENIIIHLDLKPTMSVEQIKDKYKRSKSAKVTDILKKDMNLDRTSIGLLKHFSTKETFLNPDLLAAAIKSIPVVIQSADVLDKAISSLGGIALSEVDTHFQCKRMPSTYAIGEMLDWYAPTGGYLLQGSFSMGFALANHLNKSEDAAFQKNKQIKHRSIAKEIIALKNADLALRSQLIQNGQLNEGYNEDMKALHNHNAQQLDTIIDDIGYPTMDKVGVEASEAAWLVIQHAIAQPTFMKKCATLLTIAVAENNANPKSLAYLTDRIAVFEGKSQLYGTQFDWDENGALNPNPFDDINQVNQRRKAIGLNTLEAQTEVIRSQAAQENQVAPVDFEERKEMYDTWRRDVGWVE